MIFIGEPEGDMYAKALAGSQCIVACPVCGFDYNHAGTPEVLDGEDNYATKLGPRGNVIRIPFWCEDGHHWVLLIGQHKGREFMGAVHESTDPPDPD
jgi:hypothetical protein